jgi:hypothetical protein
MMNPTRVATLLSVGGSLTSVIESVVVCAVLRPLEAPPSLSTQVTCRVVCESKSVGLSPAAKVTAASTCW